MLVLANETANSEELLDELRRIGADSRQLLVVVPVSPIETGVAATHGPLDVMGGHPAGRPGAADHTLLTLRSENLEADGAVGPPTTRALANAVDSFHPDQIVIATLPPEASVWHRFDVVDRARDPPRPAGDPRRGDPGGNGRAMTIIAGFSSSRQGRAPLHLATQISRCTGDKIIATAIVERALPAGADPIEDEYYQYVTSQASRSLERVVDELPGDLDISVVVHQSTSTQRV